MLVWRMDLRFLTWQQRKLNSITPMASRHCEMVYRTGGPSTLAALISLIDPILPRLEFAAILINLNGDMGILQSRMCGHFANPIAPLGLSP